jgi:hypothetical protein
MDFIVGFSTSKTGFWKSLKRFLKIATFKIEYNSLNGLKMC